MNGRTWPMVAAATLVLLVAWLPSSAGSSAPAEITITTDLAVVVPFEAFELSLVTSGCVPNADVTVDLMFVSTYSDVVQYFPTSSNVVKATASGALATTFSMPRALPGRWNVIVQQYSEVGGCVGMRDFVIDPPATMRFDVAPPTAFYDTPFTMTVTGGGCPGSSVWVELGPAPSSFTSGTATVSGEGGAWSIELLVTIPSSPHHPEGAVFGPSVSCGADGAAVSYPPSSSGIVIYSPLAPVQTPEGPTPTTPTAATAVVAAPSFTA